MLSLAIACTRLIVHLKVPLPPPPSPSFNVPCVVLSEQSIATDNGRVDNIGVVEILWGMLTADRPEKRRQATRGSQPAAVMPTWCRGGKARGGGGGDEGRRRLGAEGVVVDVAIMVVDELLRCWFWVDDCWRLGCLLVLANP
eukprot:scaffold73363_cov35-Cyclotella_meneghiniana.AAC.1